MRVVIYQYFFWVVAYHYFFRVVAYHCFQAIWRIPGQTSRPFGVTCQAKFSKCCHESVPQPQLKGGRVKVPCDWATAKKPQRIQAIWQMPGQLPGHT